MPPGGTDTSTNQARFCVVNTTENRAILRKCWCDDDAVMPDCPAPGSVAYCRMESEKTLSIASKSLFLMGITVYDTHWFWSIVYWGKVAVGCYVNARTTTACTLAWFCTLQLAGRGRRTDHVSTCSGLREDLWIFTSDLAFPAAAGRANSSTRQQTQHSATCAPVPHALRGFLSSLHPGRG